MFPVFRDVARDAISKSLCTDAVVEYTPTQVVWEYLRHRARDEQGRAIHGLLYKSTKREGGVNLALFIESEEVEGVASDGWKPKEHRLKMVGVEEVIKE
jgi:hypothetical protein